MVHGRKVRRGLPRVSGGDRWPPEGEAPSAGATTAAPESPGIQSRRGLPRRRVAPARPTEPAAEAAAASAPGIGRAALKERRGAVTVLAGVLALAGAATIVVLAARWLLDLGAMRDFLARYPGEYDPPAGAPVGLPGWLNWSHFFNAFLIVLIIRTGLQVRRESRAPASWTPKWNGDRKISLTVWLHQSLDLLWIVNGLLFCVLLFATDQWMRIVPTSWEVFPNALSALLQYASLNWPTENGWVSYNSLQQLAYAVTVFVAAPLAALTGVRLSGLWPESATTLNRIYPLRLARAIHFRVMLYFVAFLIVHVTLVFATGVLRNLNYMFAGTGSSTDPGAHSSDWTGLWIFLAAVVVTAIGLIATSKPRLTAPVASLFGKVSRG